MYDHGKSVNPKECVECESLEGPVNLKALDVE
jgi:hypothetical protein